MAGDKRLSIRTLAPADWSPVLLLNSRARPNVAALDDAELARLDALSDAHVVVLEGDAILGYALTFARDDAYDGEEFLTFRSQIAQPFTYIDQVVVSQSVQRSGVGRLLYEAIERASAIRGAFTLCCEVNTVPPNPASLAFHSRLGFGSLGSLATRDGRRVTLLHKRVASAAGGHAHAPGMD